MESRIMDTYIILFGARERRDYKIYFTAQDLRKRPALYAALPSLSHDVVLQYIWIITLYLCPYLQSCKLITLV